jgi:hypothetical protein
MAVFISHSHQDKAYVWLDRWEIRVGDSLLGDAGASIKGFPLRGPDLWIQTYSGASSYENRSIWES